jgi:RNA polymerase sigma factor for flagellar operon FliA
MPTHENLILEHRGFARATVISLAERLGWSARRKVEHLEELVQAGELGLVEAANAFDVSRGASFTTFAYYRIRGAALDHLRKSGDLSPAQRRALSAERAANGVAGGVADELDAVDRMSMSEGARSTLLGSLFAEATGRLAAAFVYARSVDNERAPLEADDPRATSIERDATRAVNDALGELSCEEREVIRMYYREGLSMSEIGRHFGRDKATISRWHEGAIKALRARLERTDNVVATAPRARRATLGRSAESLARSKDSSVRS